MSSDRPPSMARSPSYIQFVPKRAMASFENLVVLANYEERLQEAKRAVWRDRGEKPVEVYDAWECVEHASRGGMRAGSLAFAIRAGISFLLLMTRINKAPRLYRLSMIRHAIFGEESVRFGAMIGSFVGIYKLILNGLPLLLPAPRESTVSLQAQFRSNLRDTRPSATSHSEETIEEQEEVNDDGSLHLHEKRRARLSTNAKAHQDWIQKKTRRWYSVVAGAIAGAIAIRCERADRRIGIAQQLFVSCAQIMYGFTMRPDILPRWYNHWISLACKVIPEGVNINRTSIREGMFHLSDLDKVIAQPGVGPQNLTRLMHARELAAMSTPVFPTIAPCAVLHPTVDSCMLAQVDFFVKVFKWMFPIYGALHLIPMLLFKRQSVFFKPAKMMLRAVLGTARSSAFLGVFVVIYHSWLCGKRNTYTTLTALRGSTSPTMAATLARLVPQIFLDFLASKPAYWLGGLMCGLSLFVEEKRRRSELAMYVLPRSLEATWVMLRGKGYAFHTGSIGDILLTSLSMSMVMLFHLPHTFEQRVFSRMDLILFNELPGGIVDFDEERVKNQHVDGALKLSAYNLINKKLSEDVLVEIFTAAVGSLKYLRSRTQFHEYKTTVAICSTLSRLVLVCKKWKDIIQGVAAFWSRIDWELGSFALRCLRTCGRTIPLHFRSSISHIGQLARFNTPVFRDAILRHLSQFVSIRITGNNECIVPFMRLFFDPTPPKSFSRTETLSIEFWEHGAVLFECSVLDFPVLRTLTLKNVFPILNRVWPNVKKVKLIYSNLDFNELIMILRSLAYMPSLEVFELDCAYMADEDNTVIPSFTISRLTTLNINSLPADLMARIRQNILMPALTSGIIYLSSLNAPLAIAPLSKCDCSLHLIFRRTRRMSPTFSSITNNPPSISPLHIATDGTPPRPPCNCLQYGFSSPQSNIDSYSSCVTSLGKIITSRLVSVSFDLPGHPVVGSSMHAWRIFLSSFPSLKALAITGVDTSCPFSLNLTYLAMALVHTNPPVAPHLESVYVQYAWNGNFVEETDADDLLHAHRLMDPTFIALRKSLRVVVDVDEKVLAVLRNIAGWTQAHFTFAANPRCKLVCSQRV
ncbi:hypothetical protein EUX98_g6623 [Antrodiella citrinella]|uniref:Uncharacterized protein n=1 Tax=Antrodiella citrinella TaxID=2447956 RepID=A0A4S4MQK7_9APHY|nr:hypothetical protein EUX98_g6623 [Antrodiella citrinella]